MKTNTAQKRKNMPFARLLSFVVSASMVLSLIPTQAVAEMQTEVSRPIGGRLEVGSAGDNLSDWQAPAEDATPPTDAGQQENSSAKVGNLKILLSLDGAPKGTESRDYTVVVKNAKNEYLNNQGKWVLVKDKGQAKSAEGSSVAKQGDAEQTGEDGDANAGDDEDADADSTGGAKAANDQSDAKTDAPTDGKTTDEEEQPSFADEFKMHVSAADALQLNDVPAGVYTVIELKDGQAIEGYTLNDTSSTFEVKDVEVKEGQTAEATLHNVYVVAGEQKTDDQKADIANPAEAPAPAEAEPRNTKNSFVHEDDAIKVTAELNDPSALPADVEFVVTPLTSQTNGYNYDAYMDALNESAQDKDTYTDKNTLLYDIAFLAEDGDGKTVEVQPAEGSVKVTFEFKKDQLAKELDAPKADDVDVTHLPLANAAKDAANTTADATNIKASDVSVEPVADEDVSATSDAAIAIITDSLSVYAFSYTVDFTYDDYTYSIEGESSIALSKLFGILGIDAAVDHVKSVEFSNPELVKVEKQDADWLLTSLKPFQTDETLTTTMFSGEKYVVVVTDEQHDPSSGVWALEHAGVTTKLTANFQPGSESVTNGQQDRNVGFAMDVAYDFTSDAITAMKNYFNEAEKKYPSYTYDMKSFIDANPVAMTIDPGEHPLKEGPDTVGYYSFAGGVMKATITDYAWLSRNSQGGQFELSLKMDEEKLGNAGSWTFKLPGTKELYTIEFKPISFNTNKAVKVNNSQIGNEVTLQPADDGNYYLDYELTFQTPTQINSVKLTDTLSANQAIDGNVTVSGPDGFSQTVTNLNGRSGAFDVSITPSGSAKLAKGTYTVRYRTKLTEAAKSELNENYALADKVTNTSSWKVDGDTDVSGKSTEVSVKKFIPNPDPPTKTVKKNGEDVNGQTVQNGDTLTYTLTYGKANTPLPNDTVIQDRMSALQKLVGEITITDGNGKQTKMPADSIKNNFNGNDFAYANQTKELFSYTLPRLTMGVVTITYTTKVLSAADAKALKLFNDKESANTFQVNYGQSATTTVKVPTQEPTEVTKSVNKTSCSAGEELSYSITYGKAGQDMSGIMLTDNMTDLQTLVGNSVNVKFGDNSTASITSDNGLQWSNDSSYNNGMPTLFRYEVPQGKTGPITVTYNTRVIDAMTAHDQEIWGSQQVRNDASTDTEGRNSTTVDVDFGKRPEITVDKTATNAQRSGDEAWKPGDTVTWTVTYTSDGDMRGMTLKDEMNYVQYYNDDIKMYVNGSTSATNLPDGAIKYANEIKNRTPSQNTDVTLYEFKVSGSQPVTKVVIQYSTTLVDAATALAEGISGTVSVRNVGIGDGKRGPYAHDAEYPKINFKKDVSYKGEFDSINDKLWEPGSTVTYTMTYGNDGQALNGLNIKDRMTKVQKLESDITVTYHSGANVSNENLVTFSMPRASENNNNGMTYTNYSPYNKGETIEVYDYTFAESGIYGPITVTYDVKVIDNGETLT